MLSLQEDNFFYHHMHENCGHRTVFYLRKFFRHHYDVIHVANSGKSLIFYELVKHKQMLHRCCILGMIESRMGDIKYNKSPCQ